MATATEYSAYMIMTHREGIGYLACHNYRQVIGCQRLKTPNCCTARISTDVTCKVIQQKFKEVLPHMIDNQGSSREQSNGV